MKKWNDIKEKYEKRIAEFLGEEELIISSIIVDLIGQRVNMDLTQEELSQQSNIELKTIKEIENFNYNISLKELLKMLKVLNLKLDIGGKRYK